MKCQITLCRNDGRVLLGKKLVCRNHYLQMSYKEKLKAVNNNEPNV